MAVETRELRVLNTTDCPTVEPIPDPQFAGAIICVQADPRTSSATQQRKQDVNPMSATYLQWLKADDTYTPTESLGDYFLTGDEDADLCPLCLQYQISNGSDSEVIVSYSPCSGDQSTTNIAGGGVGFICTSDETSISFNNNPELMTTTLVGNCSI